VCDVWSGIVRTMNFVISLTNFWDGDDHLTEEQQWTRTRDLMRQLVEKMSGSSVNERNGMRYLYPFPPDMFSHQSSQAIN